MTRPEIEPHPEFRRFVESELLPGLGFEAGDFWHGLATIVARFSDENRQLLAHRDALQARIDDWHAAGGRLPADAADYRRLLDEIGYVEPRSDAFEIDTGNVDPEIAMVAGPQLVVPVSNARFALNAANARWGSLYDALYGTDVIDDADGRAAGDGYNPRRGEAVIAWVADFLDANIPLAGGRHADVTAYAGGPGALECRLGDGSTSALADPSLFVGIAEDGSRRRMLFRHHGLHIELVIDADHPIGRQSAAGLCDVVLESALTTIQDCEDSVAAVDAADKVGVYRNWLGLMRADLEAVFDKGGRSQTRVLAPDRDYLGADGQPFSLPGRSLMLVRNVGHLMTTDLAVDADGNEVFEGIVDAVVTAACGLYDLRGLGRHRNSRSGSIYIVKPKMHGSAEAAFADRLFAAVEDFLDLPRNTLKIGVMDEERRTSVNLENCIREVRHRLVFINTGFLDRTGDEIHTSMLAGPMLRKEDIKSQPWIDAYEDRNVDVGLACGLRGRAQIGKGMWAKPDEMREMLDGKQAHLLAGANCAWVPSPTAATLHATHYHGVDVADVQARLARRPMASIETILDPPLAGDASWPAADIQAELDNNAQGILGYVVRWIDQGIGCSKVPDISDTGLMEDRATLRISSQHIANWIEHGVCTEEQVRDTFARMAAVVDGQNDDDPAYRPMAPDTDSSIAFRAALDLALRGRSQPNGYTEPLLHRYRREAKAAAGG